MSNKGDLVIRIPAGSSEAHVTMTNDKGIASHKTVIMDNLISSLTSSFVFSTGLLPNNTRFFSGTTSDYMIGIESPGRVRRFLQTSYSMSGKMPKELSVPFPSCLFIFNVKGCKIIASKVYGLKGALHKETDSVCRFPFGNTYHHAGICWGSNKMPSISSPMSLISVIATFYDAPFNGDLYDGRTIRSPKGNDTVKDFWSALVYLNGKETFPLEMLYDMNIQLSSAMRDPNV